jgi:uridine phosphorylase
VSYPNFEGKHSEEAFITPQEFLKHARRTGRLQNVQVPQGMILCYRSSLMAEIARREEIEEVAGFGTLYLLKQTGSRVGVCGNFGIGAPAATSMLEMYIAWGVHRFLSIGMAGSLQRSAQISDIVLCTKAIRDEGVSHHYLASDKYAYPTKELTEQFKQRLKRNGQKMVEGPTWTIDTPYRETVAEAKHYQQEGVVTVEMEAAALFTVAQYRQVEIASAFVISDSLAELEWNPQFSHEEVGNNLYRVYEAARDVLMGG